MVIGRAGWAGHWICGHRHQFPTSNRASSRLERRCRMKSSIGMMSGWWAGGGELWKRAVDRQLESGELQRLDVTPRYVLLHRDTRWIDSHGNYNIGRVSTLPPLSLNQAPNRPPLCHSAMTPPRTRNSVRTMITTRNTRESQRLMRVKDPEK